MLKAKKNDERDPEAFAERHVATRNAIATGMRRRLPMIQADPDCIIGCSPRGRSDVPGRYSAQILHRGSAGAAGAGSWGRTPPLPPTAARSSSESVMMLSINRGIVTILDWDGLPGS